MSYAENEQLRQLQLAEHKMLCDFAKICDKHNLTYFLDFGTLLGAVRHQGFIPWDDDVDVTMPLEDYRKFLKIAQEELGDEYFLQTSDTDIDFHYSFAKIRKNGTTLFREQFKKWKVHQGIWLDIFPLVNVNPGMDFKIKKSTVKICNSLLMDSYLLANQEEYNAIAGKTTTFFLKLLYKLPKKFRLKLKNLLLNSIVFKGKNKKNKSVLWLGMTRLYPNEMYGESDKLLFEGEHLNVPAQYKQILEYVYGDYMQLPPPEKRIGHGHDIIMDLSKDYSEYLN